MTDARIVLWGRDIAAVSWLPERGLATFQYAPEFINSGIEVAPLAMPLRDMPYEFPVLERDTFQGLPGLLADSLPDKFGNALIDAWLARQGRMPESFNPVEKLCYIGNRGMGALEFEPTLLDSKSKSNQLQVAELVELANQVLNQRLGLGDKHQGDVTSIEQIIRVGTSAGGARAKAIVAWNKNTGEFRSGQVPQSENFEYWLMKFDGIQNNKDKELTDPQGYGLIEYAYSLMAKQAGLVMMPCRLHKEGGRAHFMTRRFDRTKTGDKLHMQSLCAMMHYDFNQAGTYSYEQAIQVLQRLRLPMDDLEQQFMRAVFNVMARNQDDHVKNIAYLMDKAGKWRLAPAFDVVYAYNPSGVWTSQHQMSINGKRDGFELDDFIQLAALAGIKKRRARDLMQKVQLAVKSWSSFAEKAGVDENTAAQIEQALRFDIIS